MSITAASRAAFFKAVKLVQIKTHWSKFRRTGPIYEVYRYLICYLTFFRRPRLPRRCTVVPSGLHHISTSRDAVSLGLATNSVISVWLFCQKIISLPGEQVNCPLLDKYCTNSLLVSSINTVSDPWRAFEADKVPFKGPQARLVRCFWSF